LRNPRNMDRLWISFEDSIDYVINKTNEEKHVYTQRYAKPKLSCFLIQVKRKEKLKNLYKIKHKISKLKNLTKTHTRGAPRRKQESILKASTLFQLLKCWVILSRHEVADECRDSKQRQQICLFSHFWWTST
jgi:hypothetical protein